MQLKRKADPPHPRYEEYATELMRKAGILKNMIFFFIYI